MFRSAWLLALCSCDYEAPLDPAAPPLPGGIEGDVVFAGAGLPSTTYLTLFDAADPAPPVGTGGPLTFAAVGPDAFTRPAEGLRSAPYALTELAPGTYNVNALMDVDGDFNPFSSALAGATCGDWVGTYLKDLSGTTSAPVEVESGRLAGPITVLVGQELPLERPAFAFVGAPALDLTDVIDGVALPLFRVRTIQVGAAFSETLALTLGPACAPNPDPPAPYPSCGEQPACGCDLATVVPCGTALPLQLTDADADGVVDPYPDEALAAQGVFDVWPRVYLESTAPLGEFTVDGKVYEERWVTQAFPLLGEAVAVAGASAAAGYPITPAEAAGLLGVPVGAPTFTSELSVTFVPVFVHYHKDGALVDPGKGPYDVLDAAAANTLPPAEVLGPWSATLVSFTGQTWTVPNEIGVLGLPSFDPAFDPTTQAGALTLVE